MRMGVIFVAIFICFSHFLQGSSADYEGSILTSKRSSRFDVALENLQNQLGYEFKRRGLLRQAMTHPSFSGENNKALSILGGAVIETSVGLRSISRNAEISGKDLNLRLVEVSNVDACAAEGLGLGLQDVIRVSRKTNASMPAVVCGAFRAVFGAVAVDATTVDAATKLFWTVHGDGSLQIRAS